MKYKGYTIEKTGSNSWTFSKEGEKDGVDCSLCEAKARIEKRVNAEEREETNESFFICMQDLILDSDPCERQCNDCRTNQRRR